MCINVFTVQKKYSTHKNILKNAAKKCYSLQRQHFSLFVALGMLTEQESFFEQHLHSHISTYMWDAQCSHSPALTTERFHWNNSVSLSTWKAPKQMFLRQQWVWLVHFPSDCLIGFGSAVTACCMIIELFSGRKQSWQTQNLGNNQLWKLENKTKQENNVNIVRARLTIKVSLLSVFENRNATKFG